jgi:hypothetical protein
MTRYNYTKQQASCLVVSVSAFNRSYHTGSLFNRQTVKLKAGGNRFVPRQQLHAVLQSRAFVMSLLLAQHNTRHTLSKPIPVTGRGGL